MTSVPTTQYLGVGSRFEGFDFTFGAGSYFVDAGAGNDGIITWNANDYIVGGEGSDQIRSGNGDDTIFGDRVNFTTSPAGDADFILAGAGFDVVHAGGGDDFIDGEAGSDHIDGGFGNDKIWGGIHEDYLYGGAGDDVIFGNGSPEIIRNFLQADFNGVTDAAQIMPFDVFASSAGDDHAADFLDGGAGNDTLVGNGGNDTLLGGAGNDQLDGSEGADWLDGGAGTMDMARYDGSSAGVVARLDAQTGVNGDAQGDVIIFVEGLIGSAHQDFLIGDANVNYLIGQGGNDWLFGQGGADQLLGGDGSDQLIGGIGADYLSGGAGNDQFWTLAADFQPGEFDIIADFGESASNFDYLRFEGVLPTQLTFTNSGGNVVISSGALGGSGGIVLTNFTVAQLGDQLIFA